MCDNRNSPQQPEIAAWSVEGPGTIGQYGESGARLRFSTGTSDDRTPLDLRSLPRRHGRCRACAAPVRSETAEEFFRGKQINLIIGYNPGGPYDIYSRLAATLLPKYIPGNPRIVPQNMPGVGSAKAANYLYNQAPRDGLTIGVIGQQLPVIAGAGRRQRQIRHAPVQLARPLHLGRRSDGDLAHLADQIARRRHEARDDAGLDQRGLLGGRLSAVDEPHRRHEVQDDPRLSRHHRHRAGDGARRDRRRACHTGADPVRPAGLVKEKKATVLVQYTQTRHPAFPDVPAMVEFGKTDIDKQVLALYGRPPRSAAR